MLWQRVERRVLKDAACRVCIMVAKDGEKEGTQVFIVQHVCVQGGIVPKGPITLTLCAWAACWGMRGAAVCVAVCAAAHARAQIFLECVR